jgi:transposase
MLAPPAAAVKPSRPSPFRNLPWPLDHPDWLALNAQLPRDHVARWFDTLRDRLDLQPLRESYSGRGSQAHPPEQLLSFVLYLLFRGVLAPAAWFVASQEQQPCRWLLRGLTPSRSSLYEFRDRLGRFLDDWHAQVLEWAQREGITVAKQGSLDGSFLATRASRHRLLGADALTRRLEVLRQAIAWDNAPPFPADPDPAWLARHEEELAALLLLLLTLELVRGTYRVAWPRWLARSVRGRRQQQERYQKALQRLRQQQAEHTARQGRVAKAKRRPAARLKVSATDADAVLGKDKLGVYRPLLNLQLVRATDAPLTLAWEVVARHNDRGQLKPMVQRTEKLVGHRPEQMLADGIYATLSDLQWCEEQDVEVLAPVPEEETATAGNRLPKTAFTWDAERQTYECPEGQQLRLRQRTTEKREGGMTLGVLVYRAEGEQCQQCPRRKECTSNAARGRVVKRYEGEEVQERLRERMAQEEKQQEYRKRGQTVELGYADVKTHRGLREFRSWGLPRARTQAGLVLLACNLMNTQRAIQRRRDAAPRCAS